MTTVVKNDIWDKVWKTLTIIMLALLGYIALQFTEIKTDIAVIKNTQTYHYQIIADVKKEQKEYILGLENQIKDLNLKIEYMNKEIAEFKAEIKELKRK